MVWSSGERQNVQYLKRVMNASLNEKGTRKWPRFKWMDGVKRALNASRIDVREARLARVCSRKRN